MVNALAFSGSNYLFSMLRSSDLNEERRRHDNAVEQLQAAQAKWSRKRTKRLDWISADLRRQEHAVQTFRDVDDAMREYSRVTGTKLDPLGHEPKLSDFYVPNSGQRDREIAFVVLGMAAIGHRPQKTETEKIRRGITINNGTPHLKPPKNQNRRAALGRPAIKLLGGLN